MRAYVFRKKASISGTLVTLLVGVVLFIVGFYVLTHRNTIQRWIASFEHTWHAWR